MATFIQSELEFRNEVAALVVADKTFRPSSSIFDRAAKLARRPQNETEFDIDAIARAKVSTDVERQHPDFIRIDPQHCGELAFLPHRSAAAGVNRVAADGLVVLSH